MIRGRERTRGDFRYLCTKEAFHRGMMRIFPEKGDFTAIKVYELAEYAGINRKSFYRHYESLEDLLGEIVEDLILELKEQVREEDFAMRRYNPYPVFEKLSALLALHEAFYNCLLQSTYCAGLLEQIKLVLKERMALVVPEEYRIDDQKFEASLEFVCAGMAAVYRSWYNEEQKSRSLDDLCRDLTLFTFRGLNSALLGKKTVEQAQNEEFNK